MLLAFFQWLENTPIAQWISGSDFGFPTIESIHVLALTTVTGTILIVDLRLLNLASTNRSVRALNRDTLRITWGAFAVAVLTGGLLFSSKATQYVTNLPFLMKMSALALAGVNVLVFHRFIYPQVEAWDSGVAPPREARIAGGLSLALWAMVIICGRWIGFTTH